MALLSLRKQDIPTYLHQSDFYLALNDDDEEEEEVSHSAELLQREHRREQLS
jgi:hypothetical protein